jgi:hypothetical protein
VVAALGNNEISELVYHLFLDFLGAANIFVDGVSFEDTPRPSLCQTLLTFLIQRYVGSLYSWSSF